MSAWLPSIVTMLVGVVATWILAWWYYKRAGDELLKEASELRRITALILTGLQTAGLVSVKWEKDRPVGINVTIALPTIPSVSVVAPPASIVAGPPPQQQPRP